MRSIFLWEGLPSCEQIHPKAQYYLICLQKFVCEEPAGRSVQICARAALSSSGSQTHSAGAQCVCSCVLTSPEVCRCARSPPCHLSASAATSRRGEAPENRLPCRAVSTWCSCLLHCDASLSHARSHFLQKKNKKTHTLCFLFKLDTIAICQTFQSLMPE